MFYVGNMQQKLKLRTNHHLGEVCTLVNKGKTSDSFAKHFAKHHQNQRETNHWRGAQEGKGNYLVARK